MIGMREAGLSGSPRKGIGYRRCCETLGKVVDWMEQVSDEQYRAAKLRTP